MHADMYPRAQVSYIATATIQIQEKCGMKQRDSIQVVDVYAGESG